MSTEVDRSPDIGFARPRPDVGDVDEPFRQSLADLSRQLAARRPQEPPPFDPKAKVKLAPEPREPARKTRRTRPHLALLALAAGIGLAAAISAVLRASPESAQPTRAVAVAPPLPAPVAPPSAVEITPPQRATIDPPPPPVAPVVVAAPEPPAPKGKLEGYEIMETQTRLKAIGLNPGPLDGLSGSQTVTAIKQYEASKGRPQTGKLDRELLKQLRLEVARAPAKEQAPQQ